MCKQGCMCYQCQEEQVKLPEAEDIVNYIYNEDYHE